MRIVKNILSSLHAFVLWLLVSVVFWGWIFLQITDTAPENKITVYVDAPCDDMALALALEEDMPAGIRMIKVHPFSYAMFDESDLDRADLYLIPEKDAENYVNSYLLLDSFTSPDSRVWRHEGQAFGLEAGGELMVYVESTEPLYLFFGVHSSHAAPLTGSGDDAALTTAALLLGSGSVFPPSVGGSGAVSAGD